MRVSRAAAATVNDRSTEPYLLGALIGLAAGLVLALGAALVDSRLRTAQTLAAAFGLPLLGRLGPGRGGSGGGATNGEGTGGGGTGGAGVLAAPGPAADGHGRPAARDLLVTGVSHTTDTAFAAHAMATAISDGGKHVALVGWTPGGGATYAARRTAHRGRGGRRVAGLPAPGGRAHFSHDVVVVCAPAVTESPETLAAADAVGAWFVCAQLGVTRTGDVVAVAGRPAAWPARRRA